MGLTPKMTDFEARNGWLFTPNLGRLAALYPPTAL